MFLFFNLRDDGLGTNRPENVKILSEMIKENSCITRLDLDENALGRKPEYLVMLSDRLKLNSSILEVHLRFNEIFTSQPDELTDVRRNLKVFR